MPLVDFQDDSSIRLVVDYYISWQIIDYFNLQIFKMNPRYILYFNLVVNDISLLTILTLAQVLSYIIYTLKVWLCISLLFFGVVADVNNPMTLAVMAIECYVAVCFPLRHSQIITVKKTYIVLGFIWFISVMFFLPDLFISLATEPLDFFQSRVFCLPENIFRMSILQQKNTVIKAVLLVTVCLTLIYTYFKILFTAKSASADTKKARNTVLLHSFQLMLSMLTYVNYPISTGLTILFPQSVPAIRFSVAIIVNVMPRLISPLVYGIRDKEFRKYLKRYLVCKS
ncbi:odorant receptor 131-2-like [Eucyclogobius newberryi]|uniref:odorant receptor 131-2-like n=1 Tax=Eucyclogobius newberryi TaxID=166745 RepID=UPI003B5C041C